VVTGARKKYFNTIDYGDFMVDSLPRDSLSEGRGWRQD
jgi:hypothetical protein